MRDSEPHVQMNLHVPRRFRDDLQKHAKASYSSMSGLVLKAWETFHSIPLLKRRIEELELREKNQ